MPLSSKSSRLLGLLLIVGALSIPLTAWSRGASQRQNHATPTVKVLEYRYHHVTTTERDSKPLSTQTRVLLLTLPLGLLLSLSIAKRRRLSRARIRHASQGREKKVRRRF